jgi:hypothetical protein
MIGLLLAIVCGLLGGILWIYFRDIAGNHGAQSANNYDSFTPSQPHTQPIRNHSSGGCVGVVLCLILGSTAVLFLGNAREFTHFLQWVHDTDMAYYYPDRYTRKEAERPEPAPDELYFGQRPPSNANWTDNKWTADDAPYLKIRREVDKGIADGTITGYESSEVHDGKYWREHPNPNPQSIFRNSYIGYQLSYHAWYHYHPSKKYSSLREEWPDYQRRGRLVESNAYDAMLAMKTVKNPHSYQYSRLLFLLESFESADIRAGGAGFANPDDLITEGKNLLAHRPKDLEVKLMLAKLLYNPYVSDQQKQALKYAQEVVAAKPQWPQAWEALGNAYRELNSKIIATKIQQNQSNSAELAAYRKCLQIATKDYGPRIAVEILIRSIAAKQKALTK